MKKNVLFYLVAAFVIFNIVDIATTLFILPGESNPIYLLSKSLFVMLLLKIIVVGVVCWIFYRNKFSNERAYFLFITILFYGSIALLLAQIINIYAIMHPAVLQQAAQQTTQQKISSYAWIMNLIYLCPVIFSWLCFIIYDKTFRDVEFKKGKWWNF